MWNWQEKVDHSFSDAQKKSFQEIKKRLTSLPVLYLAKAEGRFIFHSDTSIWGTGSLLWQMQEGKARLLGYASKTLPEACSRYSVTELEMTGLLINMNLWKIAKTENLMQQLIMLLWLKS